jgi:hypothetical protein
MPSAKKDLKDQLAPIAAKLREGRSIIRPVSQVVLRLKPVIGKDRFALTIDSILRWMNKRAGRALPEIAWNRGSFELSDVGAQRTAAVAIESPKYWAARLDDADKTVPMRTWVTEIGVGVEDSGDILFGARLICASRGPDEPFDRSLPGFVKQILTSGPAEIDGLPVLKQPRVVASEDDVDQFLQLLQDTKRESDVYVLAVPDGYADPKATAVPADELQDRLYGVAHVFIITSSASFFLTDRVGKELSVFHSAVRTYRPGFRAWASEPANHPLALPQRIAAWNNEQPKGFEAWLINQALLTSVRTGQREDRLPSFTNVRQLAAQLDRAKVKQAGGTDTTLLSLYESDNDHLRKELQEQKEQYDGLLAAADAERAAAVEAADVAKSQALERAHRIRLLEQRVSAATAAPEAPEVPGTLDNFEEWCKEHLVGAVELVNRAFQGVRKSDFHDPSFIYKSLILLRDFYVPMRIEGSPERRDAYLEQLAELQLEDSLTGDGVKYSEDLYSVQYAGTRRLLDRHLKGSSSRDRRFGFRLYFFWDEDGQVVVVGWLPSHLQNRLT